LSFFSPDPDTPTTNTPEVPTQLPETEKDPDSDIPKDKLPLALREPTSPDTVTLLPADTSQSGDKVKVSLFDADVSGLL
jgi:hypothetical protein